MSILTVGSSYCSHTWSSQNTFRGTYINSVHPCSLIHATSLSGRPAAHTASKHRPGPGPTAAAARAAPVRPHSTAPRRARPAEQEALPARKEQTGQRGREGRGTTSPAPQRRSPPRTARPDPGAACLSPPPVLTLRDDPLDAQLHIAHLHRLPHEIVLVAAGGPQGAGARQEIQGRLEERHISSSHCPAGERERWPRRRGNQGMEHGGRGGVAPPSYRPQRRQDAYSAIFRSGLLPGVLRHL